MFLYLWLWSFATITPSVYAVDRSYADQAQVPLKKAYEIIRENTGKLLQKGTKFGHCVAGTQRMQ